MSEIKRRTAVITLALVSNNHLVRQGLQRIIETERHIRLIGQQAAGGAKRRKRSSRRNNLRW